MDNKVLIYNLTILVQKGSTYNSFRVVIMCNTFAY